MIILWIEDWLNFKLHFSADKVFGEFRSGFDWFSSKYWRFQWKLFQLLYRNLHGDCLLQIETSFCSKCFHEHFYEVRNGCHHQLPSLTALPNLICSSLQNSLIHSTSEFLLRNYDHMTDLIGNPSTFCLVLFQIVEKEIFCLTPTHLFIIQDCM